MDQIVGHLKIREYMRVAVEKQRELVELVFTLDWKIKKAAKSLEIKYATAKNIIARYRTKNIQRKAFFQDGTKRCSFRELGECQSQVQVLCTKGGQVIR